MAFRAIADSNLVLVNRAAVPALMAAGGSTVPLGGMSANEAPTQAALVHRPISGSFWTFTVA
jgi:hypothetical protein